MEIDIKKIEDLVRFFNPIKGKEYVVAPNCVMVAVPKYKEGSITLSKDAQKELALTHFKKGQIITVVGENVNWLSIGDKIMLSPFFDYRTAQPLEIKELSDYNFFIFDAVLGIQLILKKWQN